MKLNRSKLLIALSLATIALLLLNLYKIYNLCGDRNEKQPDKSDLVLKGNKY